jgi:hypothetical protein
VSQHRRGYDTNFGLQEGNAFFGSFDFGLPPCPVRDIRSGTGTASSLRVFNL